MVPVKFVQSATRNYPESGIQKGDSYYSWILSGKTQRSRFQPLRSQTEQNPAIREFIEAIEKLSTIGPDEIDEGIVWIEEARDEIDSAFTDLPEGFQQGRVGEKYSEWLNIAAQVLDILETAQSDIQDPSYSGEPEDEPSAQEIWDECLLSIDGVY